MTDIRLYMLQRISAMVLAPLIVGHIVTMIVAVQNGLSAGEILGRTQGSLWWGLFYGLFVVAVSVHAAIGLRTVAFEWLKLKGLALDLFGWIVFAGLLALGGRAVIAVVL